MSFQPMMRVFSGIQPTGTVHLGNYLGALKNFVLLQNDPHKSLGPDVPALQAGSKTENLYCIVDLHALTVWQEPSELRQSVRRLATTFIACGLDPARSMIFVQSSVSAHAELAWMLNCIARMGWLGRMTQFKEKAGKDREAASVGLFTYPILQAADILAYRSTHVPIGEDQKQHLELARDIAQKFNNDYGLPDFFPLPQPLLSLEAARIMSLRDGTAKMSKSDPSDFSRINLTDDADLIALKIRRAKSDTEPLPDNPEALGQRPEARNLLGIMAALEEEPLQVIVDRHAGQMFSQFKPLLTERIITALEPIRNEILRLEADSAFIDSVLLDGADRATRIAAPILNEVYRTMGFFHKSHIMS